MAAIVTNLLTGGLFNGISTLINTIRGKSPEDAAKLAELASKYQEDILSTDSQSRQAQADINKAEAASTSVWVAGWRPGIGWTCAAALCYSFVLQPFLISLVLIVQCIVRHTPFDKSMLPLLDMSQLWPVLLGLLGLGGMRTYEKVNGINSGH
jgi:hypothetical protein